MDDEAVSKEKAADPSQVNMINGMQVQDGGDPATAVTNNINNELIRASREFDLNQSSVLN